MDTELKDLQAQHDLVLDERRKMREALLDISNVSNARYGVAEMKMRELALNCLAQLTSKPTTARDDLLAAALKVAPNDEVRQVFRDIAEYTRADGYDDELVVLILIGGMKDGLQYGNWPTKSKH